MNQTDTILTRCRTCKAHTPHSVVAAGWLDLDYRCETCATEFRSVAIGTGVVLFAALALSIIYGPKALSAIYPFLP